MKPFLFTFILVLLIVAWRNVRSSKSLEDKKYHQPTEKAVRSMVAKSSTSRMTPTLVNSKSSVDSAKKAVETVSAESHKPEPSVRKNVKPQTGSGTGRWRDPKYVGEQDFRELAMLLENNPGATARTLVWNARATWGEQFDKHRINSGLYRMWHRGLVEKEMVGKVPHWYLN